MRRSLVDEAPDYIVDGIGYVETKPGEAFRVSNANHFRGIQITDKGKAKAKYFQDNYTLDGNLRARALRKRASQHPTGD
jgi:hypothetical protein